MTDLAVVLAVVTAAVLAADSAADMEPVAAAVVVVAFPPATVPPANLGVPIKILKLPHR